MNLEAFQEALLEKKLELTEAGAVRPLQATMENNSRQGDMADQASGNNEVHIALKLRQTDAKILQAIEEALQRIEKGTYGICRDCGEPIAEARLRAIPWTRVVHRLQGKAKSVKLHRTRRPVAGVLPRPARAGRAPQGGGRSRVELRRQ